MGMRSGWIQLQLECPGVPPAPSSAGRELPGPHPAPLQQEPRAPPATTLLPWPRQLFQCTSQPLSTRNTTSACFLLLVCLFNCYPYPELCPALVQPPRKHLFSLREGRGPALLADSAETRRHRSSNTWTQTQEAAKTRRPRSSTQRPPQVSTRGDPRLPTSRTAGPGGDNASATVSGAARSQSCVPVTALQTHQLLCCGIISNCVPFDCKRQIFF